MKKLLILTQEDNYNLTDNSLERLVYRGPIKAKMAREADIILATLKDNDNYYYVAKNRDGNVSCYVHKNDVADLVLGKSVRLYNMGEIIASNAQDWWDEETKQLNTAMDAMLEANRRENVVNALMRVELDD